jgi:predicted RNase H-like HicB family nuclease
MIFSIDTDQETDGRWIAEISDLPGAMVYGATREEAIQRVQALALRVMADRLEHGEVGAFVNVAFQAA